MFISDFSASFLRRFLFGRRKCYDWDPKDPSVKSDFEGYTQWMRQKRDPPSNEPEQDMQTWREFRAWGIV